MCLLVEWGLERDIDIVEESRGVICMKKMEGKRSEKFYVSGKEN